MKQKLKDNGITLIALVVTIVVLLILAGITITMVLGEDGIIAQAKLAAQKTKDAEEQQEKDLQNLAEQIESLVDGGTTTPTPATIKEAIAGGVKFAESENKEITDGSKRMWVPKGYTVIGPDQKNNVSYNNKDNPKIDEGIVISDEIDAEGKSTGNEFVWVPVPEPNEMYGEDSNEQNVDENGNRYYLGKLYDFGTSSQPKPTPEAKNWTDATNRKIQWSSQTSNREPDVISGSDSNKLDTVKENLNKVLDTSKENPTAEDFKTQLQEEYKAMIESVKKYGGFYIGRYETSGLEEENPAVKAGVVPKVSTDWYTMYKNSKEIGKNKEDVTSSMIWGSQWDRVMNWFLQSGDENAKKYVTNSEGMGRYIENNSKNLTHITGQDLTEDGQEEVLNRVKNIYDMAGNMMEWTIEAVNTNYRVLRGGNSGDSGSNNPASFRGIGDPNKPGGALSFRSTLYVK